MKRTLMLGVALLAPAMLCPAAASAQSDQADATLSVDILPQTVTVVNTAGLDFGQLFPNSGLVHSSDVGSAAAWTVDTSGATQVQVEFTLPTHLVNGAATSTIPLIYQTQSGSIEDGGANPPVLFSPTAGPVIYDVDPAAPQLQVKLGADISGGGTGAVSVNPVGAEAGVHTATATLVITIV